MGPWKGMETVQLPWGACSTAWPFHNGKGFLSVVSEPPLLKFKTTACLCTSVKEPYSIVSE